MSDDTTTEIERMLLWFKRQLPRHDLNRWWLSFQPHPRLLENTTGIVDCGHMGAGRITGYGTCGRCGRRFDVPACANMAVSDPEDTEAVAKRLVHAQEWVGRDAERAGPCWGDVPHPPEPWPPENRW